MASPRTLRNRTHIAGLGLPDKDVRYIKRLITVARALKDVFIYTDKANVTKTDILFVNAESQKVMDYYAIHGPRMHAEPIFFYSRKADKETPVPSLSEYPNAKTLRSPIKLVELNRVLLEIVSTPEAAAKPGPAAIGKKADCFNILVVDDSFPVRKYLEEKLPVLIAEIDKNLEFDIQYAASGREAVNKVKEARGAFDMVFLDIIMEDIDGYRICKWIKKVKRSINVVMLTSKSSPIDRVRANLSGCDNYLSKPPKDSHLKNVILKNKRFAQVADVNRTHVS